MTFRRIEDQWTATPTMEGAGVRLDRVFSHDGVKALDPFLLLDSFHSHQRADYEKGFPWHPHRGMETITYILEGVVEHGDSLGNQGRLGPGDVQWMTAGSGIIHQEMPQGDGQGRMAGFQLWANLPARDKMMPPRYQEIKGSDIPEVKTQQGATVRVICGEVDGVKGPVRDIVTNPEYLDVSLPPNTEFTHAIPAGHTVFAYLFEGPQAGTILLFDRSGDAVKIVAEAAPVRFLLVSGQPLGEPVAWSGPIVMNTQAELRTAFAELRDGTFVKRPKAESARL